MSHLGPIQVTHAGALDEQSLADMHYQLQRLFGKYFGAEAENSVEDIEVKFRASSPSSGPKPRLMIRAAIPRRSLWAPDFQSKQQALYQELADAFSHWRVVVETHVG